MFSEQLIFFGTNSGSNFIYNIVVILFFPVVSSMSIRTRYIIRILIYRILSVLLTYVFGGLLET